MILDATTPVAYPNREMWGEYYEKFRLPLVNSLSSRYSYADREDAVEEACRRGGLSQADAHKVPRGLR